MPANIVMFDKPGLNISSLTDFIIFYANLDSFLSQYNVKIAYKSQISITANTGKDAEDI